MSVDRLIPKSFSDVHTKFHTPYKSNLVFLIFVGLFTAFVPIDIVGDMTSIGTLFAFILVCIGVLILRKTEPNMHREFRTPWVPFVPIAGVIVCLVMIIGLGWANWLRLLVWLIIGLVIYFSYSIRHSLLNK
jgi:APA family basic amino acid/polyamine antiporter